MGTYVELIGNNLALIIDSYTDGDDRLEFGPYWDDDDEYYYDPVPSDWYFDDDDEDYYFVCPTCGGETGAGWSTCICNDWDEEEDDA